MVETRFSQTHSSQPVNDNALIELTQVNKVFKTQAGEFQALKNINAQFARGEFVSITGKSGSGKSTLINMITGIDHPTSGSVRIGDTTLNKLSEGQLSVWRGRSMGIVFQFFQLLPMLSILENVMLPMDFCQMYDPAEREERARHLLKIVDLEDFAHKLPAAISGGQQQCAAVARALANDPPFILADEPTGNLDTRTAEHVLEIFEEMVQREKTIIMVTHDRTLAQRASRTLVISDGELVNPAVVTGLPMLSRTTMLQFSRVAENHVYSAGETLTSAGDTPPTRYVITRGKVIVLLKKNRATAPASEPLLAGQSFSSRIFHLDRNPISEFRASDTGPVEVLALAEEELDRLLSKESSARPGLEEAVHQQLNFYAGQLTPKRWGKR